MSADLSSGERVIGRPFQKGVSGNPGGRPAKTAKLRKALAKLDGKVAQRLAEALDDDDSAVRMEAVKLCLKYRLPVPTEKQPLDVTVTNGPTLKPEVAARIAAMDS